MSTIGQRIKNLREKRGMSTNQLAYMIGCNEEQIISWESDKDLPHILQIKPLSEVLDTTTDYLLRSKDGKNSIK